MNYALIDLSNYDFKESIMTQTIMKAKQKIYINPNLEDFDFIEGMVFFIDNDRLEKLKNIPNGIKVYCLSEINDHRFVNIKPALQSYGLSDDHIESSSSIILLSFWLTMIYEKNDIQNIVYYGFDFNEEAQYLKNHSLSDLFCFESLIKETDVVFYAIGAKYFNLIFSSLKNKYKKTDANKREVLYISNTNIQELKQVCSSIQKGIYETRIFATICSEGYEWGTIALCQSLSKYHSEAILILYSDNTDINLIKENIKGKLYFRKVPQLQVTEDKTTAERYSNTLGKFYLLGLESLERVVYLDSDILVLNHLQDFVEADGEILCSATYEFPESSPKMAVSVLSFKPSTGLFENMIESVVNNKNYSGIGDHGYFIHFYKNDWCNYGMEPNLSQVFFTNTGVKLTRNSRGVHYHGFKPWERVVGRGAYLAGSTIHEEWYKCLTKDQLVNFISSQKKEESIREANNTFRTYRQKQTNSVKLNT